MSESNLIPIKLGDKIFSWKRGNTLTETDMEVIRKATDDLEVRLEYAFLFCLPDDLENPKSEALAIWVEMSEDEQKQVVQEWSDMHGAVL
jgi:hypothetical protein